MCHSRGLNNKINNLHERALSFVYQDKNLILKRCLKMTNLSQFTWKTYIISSLKFTKLKITFLQKLWETFFTKENENYNLRSGTHLASRNVRTTLFQKKTVSNLGAKIWPLLPEELKNALSMQVFKNKLTEWKTSCRCRLCKTYIQDISFILTCFVTEFFLESN